MTKNVLVTNLKEINGIKVICNKCKAYWFVPLGGSNPPEKCINCKSVIPADRIWKLTERISDTLKAAKEYDFDLVIETEEKIDAR